ncbi:LysR substrate-binding domain-containing protein [Nesterenkonia populi]|uniref:LysR substrate-binding domain-containing protein n=1 Tax=Nesterenkonia populi TaxID=1591087 RepID=UPI0011BEB839|nr:LysR substrate-binding domain-containing protein [Nesterenkonia populi]
MPQFTLRQLEVFDAVAREGTINAAAKALMASPSAVAGALTELERSVGVQLTVRRRAHGVRLTAAGRRFARGATALLHEARGLQLAAEAQADDDISGEVTIGCYIPLAAGVLPALLQGLERRYPNIQPRFVTGDQNELHTAAWNGEIDVALLYDTTLHERMESIPVVTRYAYIIVPEGQAPDTREEDPPGTVRLEDLVDRPLVLLDLPPSREHILQVFASRGLRPQVRFRTRDVELTRSLVGRGMGYGVLAQRFQHGLTNEGLRVETLDIHPPTPPVRLHIAWPSDVKPRPAARALIDLAVGELSGAPQVSDAVNPDPSGQLSP